MRILATGGVWRGRSPTRGLRLLPFKTALPLPSASGSRGDEVAVDGGAGWPPGAMPAPTGASFAASCVLRRSISACSFSSLIAAAFSLSCLFLDAAFRWSFLFFVFSLLFRAASLSSVTDVIVELSEDEEEAKEASSVVLFKV